MTLAPIVLFCYNRVDHLRETIQYLAANPLAKDSTLYVFSDGPKTNSATAKDDAERVQKVRDYLPTIEGFADVRIKAAETNQGLANSVIRGVTEVIAQHGRVIVMEDDIICTTDFLAFQNAALDFYENHPLVFSISGYLYPFTIPATYSRDVLLLPRASSLGWSTWKDRWELADWSVPDYADFIRNPEARRAFSASGSDLIPMFEKQQKGLISSWAIRWSYTHFKQKRYCLYPIRSKVEHIGYDAGTNFGRFSRHHNTALHEGKIQLTSDVQPEPEMVRNLKRYFRPSLIRQAINRYKYGI
ncbi:glycosyl transferase family 2 [Larkinella arboricola]|uniref:Glycosyl transferase family 2 n=1 Tax=Larkinella arboricola TaxID=643671 RepID=A0A327X795_LARAB|nr:glycosyltransferase [Larkinella arboricola]RAK02845.1 glycosyl transferase family 2 [Larkinella arboricola]